MSDKIEVYAGGKKITATDNLTTAGNALSAQAKALLLAKTTGKKAGSK